MSHSALKLAHTIAETGDMTFQFGIRQGKHFPVFVNVAVPRGRAFLMIKGMISLLPFVWPEKACWPLASRYTGPAFMCFDGNEGRSVLTGRSTGRFLKNSGVRGDGPPGYLSVKTGSSFSHMGKRAFAPDQGILRQKRKRLAKEVCRDETEGNRAVLPVFPTTGIRWGSGVNRQGDMTTSQYVTGSISSGPCFLQNT